MNKCTAATSSLTHCMKAQRLLAASGIACSIVKLDSSLTRRGCAYGIEFSCDEKREVRSLLSRANIPVSQYIDGGGGVPL